MKGAEPTPDECQQIVALFNAGCYAELESLSRLLVEQYPESGFSWKALGACLLAQNKDDLPILQRASELLPNDAAAHNNFGNALRNLRQLDDAVASYHRALEINPIFAEGCCNLGIALHDQGKLDNAVASYRRAIEINPDYADAHANLANTLRLLGQLEAAVASGRRALEINPNYAEAHSNLGLALRELGRFDEAVSSFLRALEIKPNLAQAHSELLLIYNLLPNQSPALSLSEARRFGEIATRQARPYTNWRNTPESSRCLRIGLVSGDLHNHPVGYFIDSVLTAFSSNADIQIEFITFSNHFASDTLTERIKACCRGWHLVAGLSDENLARLIHDNGIDILIDLSGHTARNRLPAFAWKPAPVQVSWLGYFASTGVEAIDYLIADPWTLPETEEVNFTEKIWRLPETRLCFTPPDMEVAVSPLPALNNGYMTFGCFNNLVKVNDDVVALWSRVLTSVPGSRLFLKSKQLNESLARQRTIERFSAHGIAADRLILEGQSPRGEYLSAYHRVDISLDPFPYTGGTTSAEGLWMGVPVLTLASNRFLSRQGVGLLMNAGLPEWIAADADDYVARAALHASNLQRLTTLRNELRLQVLSSPLFDAPRFAIHFEAALRGMWRKWCDGRPEPISEISTMKTFLHVGCGFNRKDQTTRGFNTPEWNELRLDIDANVSPDIIGTMLNMSAVANASVDAIFSSHNIEHLYPHEVPVALAEFKRVLKDDGFVIIACPDLQSVCALIADNKLTEPAYTSPAGPITPLDILYGHRLSMANGNLYMAHRCGFTRTVLTKTLLDAGFAMVAAMRREACYELYAIATKTAINESDLRTLAAAHFPA